MIWPFAFFITPCSYTLFTEICDERGRKYNYIVGRVVWVAGLVALPFVGLWKIFILWKKNFFDEYTYSSKKPRRLVLFWDGVSQHEHCVCFSSPLPPGESEVANQPKEIFWGGWTYQPNKVRHALCVVLVRITSFREYNSLHPIETLAKKLGKMHFVYK